ncbi:hypothetical protein AB0873_09445 [Micromonospora sp. NPDC047707]|uniref:hypothetical protein n=1 Tax=Micromonospora sp. NPDC047707 TaxID=3154498 RepID=UPI003454A147
MVTVPFPLPTCERPAGVRVEVYSPAVDGSDGGSLDAAAYVCTDHATDTLAALRAAGFNAYPVPLAPDVERQCGHVHLFPTGNLAGDDQHPRWCDRHGCERRGEHSSHRVEIDTNRPEATIVDVALVQALDDGALPQVRITSVSDAGAAEPVAVRMLLSVSQGFVLSNRMRLITESVRRRNGGRW